MAEFRIKDGRLTSEGPALDEVIAKGDLPTIWRQARKKAGLFTRELRTTDRTTLRQIREVLGTELSARVLAHTVLHWETFVSYTGAFWGPKEPALRFLLSHLEAAANLEASNEVQALAPVAEQLKADLPKDRPQTQQEINEQLALFEEDE